MTDEPAPRDEPREPERATFAATLVTIVAESILERRLTSALRELSASGFTVSSAHGEGSRGTRSGEWEGGNVRIETVVGPQLADAILAHLAARYFEHYAVIAWTTEVHVLRGDKYL